MRLGVVRDGLGVIRGGLGDRFSLSRGRLGKLSLQGIAMAAYFPSTDTIY